MGISNKKVLIIQDFYFGYQTSIIEKYNEFIC